VLKSVTDNPLFQGLASADGDEDLYKTWPSDWRPNYLTWEPKSLKSIWKKRGVAGNIRKFNDYPCIDLTWPAFSQRAVDFLGDLLEPNGELLPVQHDLGTYYFFNCTRMTNCVDLTKSEVTKLSDGGLITSTKKLVFIEDMLADLSIFKVRTQLTETFCTQTFVDRVEASGLQGFMFIPIWPLPEGVTFFDEMYRVGKLSTKWKPKQSSEDLDIKGNTVVLRLYCGSKKPNAKDRSNAEAVMSHLEKSLYSPDQSDNENYYGDIEGNDVVDYEIRVFLTTPDCDRLVTHLLPSLRSLPWPGNFHVLKRRGEYVDATAEEEYVRL
jgi:hypothetical protein